MKMVQPVNGIEPETWAMFKLIEKVFRLALRDASRGKHDAIEWLDTVAPDWRQRAKHRGKVST